MIITFRNERLRNLLNSGDALRKKFGTKTAGKIQTRMLFLEASENLAAVPSSLPFRRHMLTGRKNVFAVNADEQFRIVFSPHQPDADLRKITSIEILDVEDYHK
ncbi:MAG TPA: hypothetical protein PLK80_18815 [bacterium]|nr:hypothetical protein [bacterium]HPI78791.1 hypothetical protein [bacterium]